MQPSEADEVATQLAKLDQMKAEGILTEKEYKAKRKELLGRL